MSAIAVCDFTGKRSKAKGCPSPSCLEFEEPELVRGGNGWYHVICPTCGMQGPEDMEPADAIDLWNYLKR